MSMFPEPDPEYGYIYGPGDALSDASEWVDQKLEEGQQATAELLKEGSKNAGKVAKWSTLGIFAAVGGGLIVSGLVLQALSEGKNVGKIIDAANPGKALKGFKVGF